MFPAAWLVESTLRLPHSVDSLANLPIIIEVAKYFLQIMTFEKESFLPCDKPYLIFIHQKPSENFYKYNILKYHNQEKSVIII